MDIRYVNGFKMKIQDYNTQGEICFTNLSQNLRWYKGYWFLFLIHFFLNVLNVSLLQLAREVLDIAAGMIKPGVTTEEIDHAVHLVRTLLLRMFFTLLDVSGF